MEKSLAFAVLLLLAFGCTSQAPETGPNPPGAEAPPPAATNPIVVLETSKGNIQIELYPAQSPATVENFLSYAGEHFYDGTCFHRVMDGFMIQGGGFTPQGVERHTRSPIPLESRNGLSNLRGYVAMARTADPDSATAQFFINVADNPMLDYMDAANPGYAVFGKVISGMDVVDEIKSAPTSARGPHGNWPTEDIVIIRAYVKQ